MSKEPPFPAYENTVRISSGPGPHVLTFVSYAISVHESQGIVYLSGTGQAIPRVVDTAEVFKRTVKNARVVRTGIRSFDFPREGQKVPRTVSKFIVGLSTNEEYEEKVLDDKFV